MNIQPLFNGKFQVIESTGPEDSDVVVLLDDATYEEALEHKNTLERNK